MDARNHNPNEPPASSEVDMGWILRKMARHQSTLNIPSINNEERSFNSSYADVFETSGVVIRDYEGSFSKGTAVANAVTYNLNKCKANVIVPYYTLLSLIAWRPLGKRSNCPPTCLNFWNAVYTFFCFCVLIFWYYIRVKTCQGHLNIDHPLVTLTPFHTLPSDIALPLLVDNDDGEPSQSIFETTSSPDLSTQPAAVGNFGNASHTNQLGNICQHLLGSYIIPSLLHFLAFLIGFFHFRIQEHEGLYALMEKVYLQSSYPSTMTRSLRIFLLVGFLWLCLALGNSIFYFIVYGFSAGHAFREPKHLLYTMTALIVFAGLFSNCVYVAVVLSYCGQCQLLQYYIIGVQERLEEKSTELKTAMKDVLEIKGHFSRMNGMLSLSMSCVVFDLFITVIITAIMLFNYKKMLLIVWLYRFSVFIQYGAILMFLLYKAALLTYRGNRLKEKALAIRVFGYQSHTHSEIDSFLNFLYMVKLQAEVFTIPVKLRYLWGFLIFGVQFLIIAFQTGLIVNESKWL